MYVCMYVRVCVCMYVCMYVLCVYVLCVCVYIIYIHTHIHTHKCFRGKCYLLLRGIIITRSYLMVSNDIHISELIWWWKLQVPLKCWYLQIYVHGVIFRKTASSSLFKSFTCYFGPAAAQFEHRPDNMLFLLTFFVVLEDRSKCITQPWEV
jgi:hypothetical protein